jgi:hypothetical protein
MLYSSAGWNEVVSCCCIELYMEWNFIRYIVLFVEERETESFECLKWRRNRGLSPPKTTKKTCDLRFEGYLGCNPWKLLKVAFFQNSLEKPSIIITKTWSSNRRMKIVIIGVLTRKRRHHRVVFLITTKWAAFFERFIFSLSTLSILKKSFIIAYFHTILNM